MGNRAAISLASAAPSARSRWISPATPPGTSSPRLPGTSPNRNRVPSARIASIAVTLSAISPYRIDFDPHELLPAIPPIVHRALVLGSTGKNSPDGFNAAFRCDSTSPGSTHARRAVASTSITRRRCFVQSITSARLTVCPHWLVPPPRGSTGTPCSRAIAIVAATSPMVRGTTTPTGSTW